MSPVQVPDVSESFVQVVDLWSMYTNAHSFDILREADLCLDRILWDRCLFAVPRIFRT